MRPTPEKERERSKVHKEVEIVHDPVITKGSLTPEEADVWLEFAGRAVSALAGNADLTTNNPPTFVTDEACLMADRMLLAYRFRTKSNNDKK